MAYVLDRPNVVNYLTTLLKPPKIAGFLFLHPLYMPPRKCHHFVSSFQGLPWFKVGVKEKKPAQTGQFRRFTRFTTSPLGQHQVAEVVTIEK